MSFIQSLNDPTGQVCNGLNNHYAIELDGIDQLFNAIASAKDSVAGNAMEVLYDKLIAVITGLATETPPATQVRIIAPIVNKW